MLAATATSLERDRNREIKTAQEMTLEERAIRPMINKLQEPLATLRSSSPASPTRTQARKCQSGECNNSLALGPCPPPKWKS